MLQSAAECCRLVTALCATLGALLRLRPMQQPRLSRLSHRLVSPALARCRSLGTNAAQAARGEKNFKAGLYEFYLKTINMYKTNKI